MAHFLDKSTVYREHPVFDWGQVIIDGLIPKLICLREHIKGHNFIADADKCVQEINGALDIWDLYNERFWSEEFDDIRDPMPVTELFDAEQAIFEAFMDYLKYHMRNWWD